MHIGLSIRVRDFGAERKRKKRIFLARHEKEYKGLGADPADEILWQDVPKKALSHKPHLGKGFLRSSTFLSGIVVVGIPGGGSVSIRTK